MTGFNFTRNRNLLLPSSRRANGILRISTRFAREERSVCLDIKDLGDAYQDLYRLKTRCHPDSAAEGPYLEESRKFVRCVFLQREAHPSCNKIPHIHSG